MTSDFTIYNASTKEPIVNVLDTFLFFNILTNNLYKVFRTRQCLRYKYTYVQNASFWISTDLRRTDYLDVPNTPQNGYIYYLAPYTFEGPLAQFLIPILSLEPLGTHTFTSTIGNPDFFMLVYLI